MNPRTRISLGTAQQVVRNQERADRVFRHDAARVADDVGVSKPNAGSMLSRASMQATTASFLAGRMGSWPSRNSWAKRALACCASSMALMESPRASLPAQATPAVREWASSTPMGRTWLCPARVELQSRTMGCRLAVERCFDLLGRVERCVRQIREDGDDHSGITVQAEGRRPAHRAAAMERPAMS